MLCDRLEKSSPPPRGIYRAAQLFATAANQAHARDGAGCRVYIYIYIYIYIYVLYYNNIIDTDIDIDS